jgi:hypothetical protein
MTYIAPRIDWNVVSIASGLAEKIGGRAGVGCLLYFYGFAFGLLFFLFGDGDV